MRLAARSAAGIFFALALALAVCSANAAPSFLLKNAIVHPLVGPSLTNADVLVRNGKIVQVGQVSDASIDETISLAGMHLFPGLIVSSTQLGLVEIESVRGTRDGVEVGEYTPDVQSWIAVNPDSELLPVARANGITHIVPVPEGGIVSGQSGLVALKGWTAEEMVIKHPVALHVFWPSLTLDPTPKEDSSNPAQWKSLVEQAKERRVRLAALDSFFSEANAYSKAKDAEKSSRPNDRVRGPAWEAMRPWVRSQLPVTVHADEFLQIQSAIRWAATNGYKMILAGGRDAWMLADELRDHRIPVIYEATFTLPPRDTDSYDVQFRAPARLFEAGVRVLFGYGGKNEASTVRNLPYAAAQAVAFGLPREEAWKGMTLYPAEVFGLADRIGAIAPGRDATFFAVDGDILDIRSVVKHLWIAGEEMSLETRHTRLYEKYRRRPKPTVP